MAHYFPEAEIEFIHFKAVYTLVLLWYFRKNIFKIVMLKVSADDINHHKLPNNMVDDLQLPNIPWSQRSSPMLSDCICIDIQVLV